MANIQEYVMIYECSTSKIVLQCAFPSVQCLNFSFLPSSRLLFLVCCVIIVFNCNCSLFI
uniref:Uncharacterized protein n=1 Tax=Anguilla anguilla TaxID=7936 RepID=A0A0E9RG13_ANGAN